MPLVPVLPVTLLLAAMVARPQAVPDGATARDAEVLAKFDALPALRQAMLVHRIEQRLVEDGDAAVRRILALRPEDDALPAALPPAHFDADEWTNGVAPARQVIGAGDPRHRAVRATMPAASVLPGLARGVRYDWRSGRVVRGTTLGWRERFGNLLQGYPPGADAAYARVLAALDHDLSQRALADYFEHTYANRDGIVYDGITLYEAWYADDTMEMPDVDAIAFAVRLLNDRSYVSPIPADPRRDWLYAKIHAAALAHRQYRTMLEAAAAAFVRAEPEMDPMYARLAPRFHYLFATLGDDLPRVRVALSKLATRDALIQSVDGAVVGDPRAMDRRERRKRELAAMAARVRGLALEGLEAEGG